MDIQDTHNEQRIYTPPPSIFFTAQLEPDNNEQLSIARFVFGT